MKDQTDSGRKFQPLWPDTGEQAGLSRTATYAAARRGDIPAIRIGGRWLVPIAKWRELAGEG